MLGLDVKRFTRTRLLRGGNRDARPYATRRAQVFARPAWRRRCGFRMTSRAALSNWRGHDDLHWVICGGDKFVELEDSDVSRINLEFGRRPLVLGFASRTIALGRLDPFPVRQGMAAICAFETFLAMPRVDVEQTFADRRLGRLSWADFCPPTGPRGDAVFKIRFHQTLTRSRWANSASAREKPRN